MLEIVLVLLLFLVLVVPMGTYLYHIASFEKTFCDPLFNKVDNMVYRLCGIDKKEMNWKNYFKSLVVTNIIIMIIGFLILSIQHIGILNPNNASGMKWDLSFNTVISFMTNTNLQHYAGESTLSYLSQMAVITFMMFTAAATGYAVCIAFIRGIVYKKGTLGNFYVDITRITTRVLIPLALIVGVLLVSQGVPQTFDATKTVTTIEGKMQDIPLGPIASLESIKHIGTNGGGFLGANSAIPLENPTALSNILEILSMMILPGSCVVMFGLMVASRKKGDKKFTLEGKKQARVIFAAMSVIFLIGLSVIFLSESAGNPYIDKIGINQALGNMEGKEMRFGIAGSSLFTSVTTSFTTGSVNNMHDSLNPISGGVALLNMMLNVVFGGKGVGLMNMITYVILTVFICSLMVGRTPEYLGKKIEEKEMKLVATSIILHPLLVLGFTSLAVIIPAGFSAVNNPGFHGFSQILYEYASSAANNGSGFEGLSDNTVFWNITTAVVMFIGRYVNIAIQLAIAGLLSKKVFMDEGFGTLKTNNVMFGVVLVIIVMIFAGLTFLPALALGPISEHLTLWF